MKNKQQSVGGLDQTGLSAAGMLARVACVATPQGQGQVLLLEERNIMYSQIRSHRTERFEFRLKTERELLCKITRDWLLLTCPLCGLYMPLCTMQCRETGEGVNDRVNDMHVGVV